jgi:hypothetical protein
MNSWTNFTSELFFKTYFLLNNLSLNTLFEQKTRRR